MTMAQRQYEAGLPIRTHRKLQHLAGKGGLAPDAGTYKRACAQVRGVRVSDLTRKPVNKSRGQLF